MKHKIISLALILALLLIPLSACAQDSATPSETTAVESPADSPASSEPGAEVTDDAAPVETESEQPSADDGAGTVASSVKGGGEITLNGDLISFTGDGIAVDGTTVTISAPGDYSISGTLDDGQIVVSVTKDDKVKITLNGVTVSNSMSAPFNATSADKVTLILADGTVNTFTDANNYTYAEGEDEPNACIFSKDDLTIEGNGSLVVNANFNNGIGSKNDLRIKGGEITVNAVNDGLRGKDSVEISGGTLDITTSTGDGIDSNNSEEEGRGYVLIEDGTITINSAKHGIKAESYVTINGGKINIIAGGDGIKADLVSDFAEGTVTITAGDLDINAVGDGIEANTVLTIEGGTFNIISGGGSLAVDMKTETGFGGPGGWGQVATATTAATEEETVSAKGLKGASEIIISGGTFTIDSADDAIHSNDSITINGGVFTLSTADDGIHADSHIVINSGDITVSYSYEGIEAAIIDVYGSTINVTASDDGFNAGGGSDSSGFMGGFGGMADTFSGTSSYQLNFYGGEVFVNASGDGLDSNGTLNFYGGTIIVEGPTSSGDASLDSETGINLTGGYLLAIGSIGMAEYPTSPEQNTLTIGYTAAAESEIVITANDGTEVLRYTPKKTFGHIVFSSEELITGTTYTVTIGGAEVGTLTLTGGLNSVGTVTGGMGGMGGGGRGGR